jgi:transcription elongation GreA/GreB family factor
MSRAFVKEDDAAPEPPLPERPISAAPNRVTRRGAELIRRKVDELKDALAREPGDNAATIRRDLRYWQSRQASMQVITPDAAPQTVGFGCLVTIQRGPTATITIRIVGEDEADPAGGAIAWTAPLAQAIEGAEPNDIVELDAGGRRETIKVVSISPGA